VATGDGVQVISIDLKRPSVMAALAWPSIPRDRFDTSPAMEDAVACDTPIDRVCTAMPHLGMYPVEGLQNEVAH
jgi:hypothetical protein